ncbi:MAG: hypothetical protein ACK56F_08720 [bacterium]
MGSTLYKVKTWEAFRLWRAESGRFRQVFVLRLSSRQNWSAKA